jgi:predicted nucleotidyltransferase component of viral defense system
MQDIAASVIAKLKSRAKQSGKPLQLHMQLFCQEEFLRRLSLSKYADNLILKGGLFIYTLTNFESRATIDVDFLLRLLPSGLEDIRRIVDEIIATDAGNDFIVFEAKGFEHISQQRKYQGVSFQLIGKIKNTRTPFNIDIGVGDIIFPNVEKRIIPVQLAEFKAPEISTYSLESTVAEKFDAILQRLEMTSRMKDFYDIWFLAVTFDFDGEQLLEAIKRTLKKRGTSFGGDSLKNIIAFSEDGNMQMKWQQFVNRLNISPFDFSQVLHVIHLFLTPIWQAIIDKDAYLKTWHAKELTWL